MITLKSSTRFVAKFLICALLAMGGACSSPAAGVGGESHFVCMEDRECTAKNASYFCDAGECKSQLALAGPVPGPCGKSPFVGKYLWKVGNCEVGAITPVDATSCTTTVCGGNAKTFDECVGSKLVEFRIEGLTLATPTDAPMTFIKHVDCTQFSKNDQADCAKRNCQLALVQDLYFENINRLSDNLWLLMDEPWPGKDGCGDAVQATHIDLSSCEDP